MNEQDERPLTDNELSALLRKWDVSAPARLEARVFAAPPEPLQPRGQRKSWWRFLLRGYIPVPVPVACCLIVLLVAALWRSERLAVTCSAANAPVVQAAPPATAVPVVVNPLSTTCPVNSRC